MTAPGLGPIAPDQRVVIAGAGLSALRAAEELRKGGWTGEIVIVGAEARPPYDRPQLSKEFLRGVCDDTTLKPHTYYADKHVQLRLGTAATRLDTVARQLELADGSRVDYDQLVIATGLVPRWVPGWPRLPGTHVPRSADDAVALRADMVPGRKAAIVGAGFIGCELAASMRRCGLEVLLVEPQPVPLASVLGEQVGRLVARMHREEGVDLRCGIGARELVGDDRVQAIALSDGTEVKVDLVVAGIGSVPVTQWLADSGVGLGASDTGGGVLADEVGSTNVAGVWAIGDVAAWRDGDGRHRRVEHWTHAGEQAKVLARAMISGDATQAHAVPYVWSDQYDVKIQLLGSPAATDTVHVVADDGRKFLAYFSRDARLTAVVGAGVPAKVMKTRAQIAVGAPIADLLGQ